MITKRLIYHFYVGKDFENNPIYKEHQYLLKKYSDIFDEALFVISTDNINDKDRLKEVKRFLLECNFKNIEFRVEENNSYYEVATFEKYILNKLDTLDGMTFFAHTKGTNDYYEADKDKDAVLKWVFALYYLSLNFYKESEKIMFGSNASCCFYGGLLTCYNDKTATDKHFPKNKAMYVGTYYWLNGREIYYVHKNELPEVYNRFYAENFPGNICCPHDFELYSHDYKMIDGTKAGNIFSSEKDCDVYIKALLNEEEASVFEKEYNEMKKEIGI